VIEASARGYSFDATKVPDDRFTGQIEATDGQLAYEWSYLLRKLELRDRDRATRYATTDKPDPHPLFRVVPGGIADWERP